MSLDIYIVPGSRGSGNHAGHRHLRPAGPDLQCELSDFWQTPGVLDASLFDAFRRVLADRRLIRGGFFSDRGLTMLLDGAVQRLEITDPLRVVPDQTASQKSPHATPQFVDHLMMASVLTRS